MVGSYVRQPKARNPESQMPANPEYDDATMHALIAYFRMLSGSQGLKR
jgi:hypothetical protein